jgi:hypothetical protein
MVAEIQPKNFKLRHTYIATASATLVKTVLLSLPAASVNCKWQGWLPTDEVARILRVGQNHTFIGIYGVYTVFLAGKSPYIRSYTVCIYGSGQPYIYCDSTG